jgi:hypothetical protein
LLDQSTIRNPIIYGAPNLGDDNTWDQNEKTSAKIKTRILKNDKKL